MTDAELIALLAGPESDRLERKESLAKENKSRVREAICAYANDLPDHRAPGIIIIGQRDDGSCAGTPINDELVLELSNIVGKDPRGHLPGSYVQFVRFDGLELVDPIRTQREVGGPLGEILSRMEDLFEANNDVLTTITGVSVETRRPAYPLDALRQLLRNAIMHRSYQNTNAPVRVNWFADRVEIQNPGGPFGQVTIDNFGTPGIADYRNPHVAEALKVLGFVQRFGVGIAIARAALEKNGNPEAEFHVTATYVNVTVRRAS